MITHLLVPTNIPATPPPPPGPTLGLSGLQILDNPGIGGNAAIARAALRYYGEYYRPDGVPWVGWCEMYIGNVMDEAGVVHPRFASAILDAISGPLYRGDAPAGSLVFFDQRSSPYGHVGIALGDKTMLSALGGGIVRTPYTDWSSYLGWRPYGTATPDEAPVTVRVYSATSPDNPSLNWQTDPTIGPDNPSLSWQTDAMIGSDNPSLSWQAAATMPDDPSLGLFKHAEQVANDALRRLTPSVYRGWGIASPLLAPHQTMA